MKIEPRKESDRGGWLYAVVSQCAGRKGRMGKGALPGMWSTLLEKTGGCRRDLP